VKVRLRKTDRLFREYALRFYNCTYARCHTRDSPDNCRGLHVSHYWGRVRENTRFDEVKLILRCRCGQEFEIAKDKIRKQ